MPNPSNVEKSKILNKLKTVAKGAWKRSREVEAKARGGGGWPPNLKGIVAACQSYKMGQTNNAKKDPYFVLTAIAKDPDEYVGKRATFMWFINDSEYATVEDNLNQMSNDLQLIYSDPLPEDIAGIPNVLKDLCERGVHLVFDSGGPRTNGRSPNLFIQGLAEEWPDEPQEGRGEQKDRPARGKAGKGGKPAAEQDAEGGTEGDASSENGAPTEDDWVPKKGEDYYYTPPKGKQTLCKVTAVDLKKKTLTLKGGKPPKEYTGLKFTDERIKGEAE